MAVVSIKLNEYELKEIMIALDHQYDRFVDSKNQIKVERSEKIWELINKIYEARREVRGLNKMI